MRRTRRLFIAVVTVVASALPAAAGATPKSPPPGHSKCGTNASVRFEWLKGYDDPATPDDLDRVGVLKIGRASARNVLVLNPGTSAGSTYFAPLAEDIVRDTN